MTVAELQHILGQCKQDASVFIRLDDEALENNQGLVFDILGHEYGYGCTESLAVMLECGQPNGEVEPGSDQAIAEVRRLMDLVRHQRMELYEAELITDAEYAELAKDHPAVARLETYDGLRAENRKLREALEDIRRWSAGNGRYEWAASIARRAAEALRAEPAGEPSDAV